MTKLLRFYTQKAILKPPSTGSSKALPSLGLTSFMSIFNPILIKVSTTLQFGFPMKKVFTFSPKSIFFQIAFILLSLQGVLAQTPPAAPCAPNITVDITQMGCTNLGALNPGSAGGNARDCCGDMGCGVFQFNLPAAAVGACFHLTGNTPGTFNAYYFFPGDPGCTLDNTGGGGNDIDIKGVVMATTLYFILCKSGNDVINQVKFCLCGNPIVDCPPMRTYNGCTTANIGSPDMPFSAISASITAAQFQAAGGSLSYLPDPADCDYTITYKDVASGTCPITVTRTYTVQMADCASSFTCTQTITIQDQTPPTITCTDPVSPINCPATPVFIAATATDACDPSVTITSADVTTPGTPTCPGNYSVTRTWTATDDCGNTATCSRAVVVQDITAPTITCTDPVSPINCPATPVFIAATATDACDPSVTITSADVTTPGSPTCPGNYSVTRTWTATDDCGNTATCSRTVVVQDITAPTITCTNPVSPINCPATPVFIAATATDACDPSVTITSADVTTPGSPTCPGNYSVTRTWTATDDCGNTATCSRTVVLQDITAPTITCTDPVSPIDCPATPVFIAATATDACDPSVTITSADVTTPGTPTCPGNYSVTRTWTATDDCGNTATCSRTVVVKDDTKPVITCTDPVSPIDCPATPVFIAATATDACDPDVTITSADVTTPGTPTCPGNYSVARTWTATDDCGNTATCSRTVVVHDVTSPTITCTDPVSPIDCPATPVFIAATATDACDPSVSITSADVTTPGMPTCPGNYSVTRTWTATDDCGNTATCSKTVVVMDDTPPVVTLIGGDPITICQGPPFVDPGATAMDDCSGDVSGSIVVTGTVDENVPGTYILTYTATDECGNSASITRTVIVDAIDLILTTSGPSSAFCGELITYKIAVSDEFENLASLQYSINWNPAKLMYVSHTALQIGGAGGDPQIFAGNTNLGQLTYSWIDPSGFDGEDLVDGTSVAENTDETTGFTKRVVIDWRTNQRGDGLRPAIAITRFGASRSRVPRHRDHAVRRIAIGAKRRLSWGLGWWFWGPRK